MRETARPPTPLAEASSAAPRTRWSFARGGRVAIGLPPLAWLVAFFLVPFAIVLKISLSETQVGIPPYAPLLTLVDDTFIQIRINLANFRYLFSDSLYAYALLNSVRIAAIATLFCLLLGYPMAYAIARSPRRWRTTLLMMVVLPFWTSFLLRVYAWIGILKTEGLVNNFLLWLGAIDEPLPLLYSDFAVLLGIVYSYLPFMILPLYATLEKMDLSLLEAAADLGCRPFRAFLAVTLPLSRPGMLAGAMLVFIPAVGEFVIPDLLGGPDTLMIGRVLWDDFFSNRDWPVASAVAVALLILLVAPLIVLQRAQARDRGGPS